ncbi:MAG: 1-aminocyclopropane-1-carboxylate deaminase/D-cysteine desulfhydrase [Bacillota bacterium]
MYNRVILSDLPSPMERLTETSRIYNNNIYIKRDDIIGPSPGGNKTRKLEYILGEAKKAGANHLITCGSTFSNHCRLTAMAAIQQGLDCTLILSNPDDYEHPAYDGNYFLYDILGVEIKLVEPENRDEELELEYQRLESSGAKPYLIRSGGYGNAGIHGYVEAAAEIRADINFHPGEFDYIFLASGTGTTQAGLMIGNYLHHIAEAIIGISVEAEQKVGESKIRTCIEEYCQEHNLPYELIIQDLIFLDNYRGGGYGVMDEEVIKTIKEVARREAILLDPVYTGRAFQGMINFIQNNHVKYKNILFLHSGGLPILFKNSKEFQV